MLARCPKTATACFERYQLAAGAVLFSTRTALASLSVFDGVHSDRASLLQLGAEACVLGFEPHHSANALEVHPLVGQLRDSALAPRCRASL